MPTDRKLMQQSLDALERGLTSAEWRELFDALRARLAQPEPEWQGLTENDFGIWREPAIGILRWAEAVLKERNT